MHAAWATGAIAMTAAIIRDLIRTMTEGFVACLENLDSGNWKLDSDGSETVEESKRGWVKRLRFGDHTQERLEAFYSCL